MGKKKTGPPTPWEIAKPLLERDYLDGTFSYSDPPRVVVLLRDEYQAVKYANFSSNLLAMKKRISEHKNRADVDGWNWQYACYQQLMLRGNNEA